jgi:hypothetical protein
MRFSSLSIGTKSALKKVSVLDLVSVLTAQKQLKIFFLKTVKMHLVPATNLKNTRKFRGW